MLDKKAILFDNDGVLTHTEAFWIRVNTEVMRELGIVYTREDFIQHTFIEDWGTQGWLEQNGHAVDAQNIFKQKRDDRAQAGLVEHTTCDPMAGRVIDQLQEQHQLALVTNTNEYLVDLLTQKFSFLEDIAVHVVRDDYIKAKPAPDGYLAALLKLGVAAEEAVVVEDSPRGIAAAKAAGIAVIGIKNPDFPELDLSESDIQIEKLSDLLSVF